MNWQASPSSIICEPAIKLVAKQHNVYLKTNERGFIENAQALGANAVLAMRFDSNEIGGMYQEILAYGTACVIEAQS